MSANQDDHEIDVSTLGRLEQRGSGGQGTVYAVTGQKISNSWPVAFKEYKPDVLQNLDANAMAEMVRFPMGLSFQQGNQLFERAAWPWRTVARQGSTVGFLMRLVPEEYRLVLHGPQGDVNELAATQLVLNGPAFLAVRGIVFDNRLRLEFLRDVAETLAMFHALGIVVGDLSPRNLLFSARALPRCFFVDCDAMRLNGATALEQAETPEWQIPAGEELATPAADAYKFALLGIRLVASDQFTRDPAALANMSADLADLARRGLSEDPADRPAPDEWIAPLGAVIAVTPTSPTQILKTVSPVTPPVAPNNPPGAAPPAANPFPFQIPPAVPKKSKLTVGRIALAVVALFALCGLLVHLADTSASPTSTSSTSTDGTFTNTSRSNTSTTAQTNDEASAQAEAFNDVLNNAEQDRSRISDAIRDLGNCVNLPQSIDALRTAVNGRVQELAAARTLQTDAIDGDHAKSYLIAALGYSLNADRDFLTWAKGVSQHDCSRASEDSAAHAAAGVQSKDADRQKDNLVQAWNPIAAQYGLPQPVATSI